MPEVLGKVQKGLWVFVGGKKGQGIKRKNYLVEKQQRHLSYQEAILNGAASRKQFR